MPKYQFYAILAGLAVINANVADNYISSFVSFIMALIFASLSGRNWGSDKK